MKLWKQNQFGNKKLKVLEVGRRSRLEAFCIFGIEQNGQKWPKLKKSFIFVRIMKKYEKSPPITYLKKYIDKEGRRKTYVLTGNRTRAAWMEVWDTIHLAMKTGAPASHFKMGYIGSCSSTLQCSQSDASFAAASWRCQLPVHRSDRIQFFAS